MSISGTAAETSYSLNSRINNKLPIMRNLNISDNSAEKKETQKEQKVPSVKYLDIDSSFRDRFNYPNPADFVVQINYPNRSSDPSGSINPVSLSLFYHGMFDPFQLIPAPTYQYITQGPTASATDVQLDIYEPIIYNYYINNYLQIGTEFRLIIAYDGTTKIATIDSAFTVGIVPLGTPYLTRKALPIFLGTVAAIVSPTEITLDASASSVNDFYKNSYLEFYAPPSANFLEGNAIKISSYNGITKTATLASPFPYVVNVGDSLDINSFSKDSASSLLFSGNPDTSLIPYYEIELLYILVPIQLLKVAYGGYLSNYPYIYVSLFNEGNQMSKQVLYSNNPNSTQVLFKTPIDQYFGDSTYYCFKESKQKHVVKFQPFQNFRFQITLPDGETLQYDLPDKQPPLSPDPQLQISALFSLKKV